MEHRQGETQTRWSKYTVQHDMVRHRHGGVKARWNIDMVGHRHVAVKTWWNIEWMS